jgi:hypothetical protein
MIDSTQEDIEEDLWYALELIWLTVSALSFSSYFLSIIFEISSVLNYDYGLKIVMVL